MELVLAHRAPRRSHRVLDVDLDQHVRSAVHDLAHLEHAELDAFSERLEERR